MLSFDLTYHNIDSLQVDLQFQAVIHPDRSLNNQAGPFRTGEVSSSLARLEVASSLAGLEVASSCPFVVPESYLVGAFLVA